MMNNNKYFFTFFKIMLFGFFYVTGVVLLQAQSHYEERVIIPKYNPNDPTHVLITPNNGKWNRYVLNDPNNKHFYVKPGKYHTRVNLTASGTKKSRRTMSLYNGNNIHPASLPLHQVADIRLNLMGADYWILDRLSNINDTKRPSFFLHNGATNNIINRLYVKDYYDAIIITNLSHNNTIQNSYFDHMTHEGRKNDNVAIAVYSDKHVKGRIFNTHIVNNDIRNANDGIQLVIRSVGDDNDYQGTVIDNNNIWFDGDAYTNGDYAVNGYNQKGQYMVGENAIDLKAGSYNPANPIKITNNRMWGYLQRDETVGGSFSTGQGKIISVHYGVRNVKFNSNILFNSQVAFAVGEAIDWEVKNNIIANMNTINPLDSTTYAAYFYKSQSVKIENNIFKNIPQSSTSGGYLFRFDAKTKNSTFRKNMIINAKGTSPDYGNIMGENYLYQSKVNYSGKNINMARTDVETMEDFVFLYERFTSKPKKQVLKGVLVPKNSRYYGKAGSVIGSVSHVQPHKHYSGIIMFLLE